MNLDLKKFKKVSADKNHTKFEHPNGHIILVAHEALPKGQKSALKGLASGGKVKPTPEPTYTPQILIDPAKLKKTQEGFRKATKYAEGGEVEEAPPEEAIGGDEPAPEERSLWQKLTQPIPMTSLGKEPVLEAGNAMEGQSPGMQPAEEQAPDENYTIPKAETAPTMPQDSLGADAMDEHYTQGYENAQAGIRQEANAAAGQQQAVAEAGQETLDQQKSLQEHFMAETQALNNERQAFINDLNNQHIDPERYIQNMSSGNKIMTTIGLILGGLGSGGDPRHNPALQIMQQNVDRDIESQKAELGKKNTLLAANMRQFGNLHDATAITRAMTNDMLATRLKVEAAKTSSPIIKARALQASGQLEMQSAAVFAQTAARKALAKGMQSGQVSPARAIQAYVPQNLQGKAMEEMGTLELRKTADAQIVGLLSRAHPASQLGKGGSLPWTTNAKILKETEAQIRSLLQANWKGPMTDQEAKKIVEPYLSGMTDSPKDLQRRIIGLTDMIRRNGKPTPILDSYGLAPKQKPVVIPNMNAPTSYRK